MPEKLGRLGTKRMSRPLEPLLYSTIAKLQVSFPQLQKSASTALFRLWSPHIQRRFALWFAPPCA